VIVRGAGCHWPSLQLRWKSVAPTPLVKTFAYTRHRQPDLQKETPSVGYNKEPQLRERRPGMTAHFYCWEPALGLDPHSPDFRDRRRRIQDSGEQPTQRLLDFVSALSSRYPDDANDDSIWAAAPLRDEISGGHINFAVTWSAYDKVISFVVTTAHEHGLHCYDPQSGKFYPFSGPE